MSIVYVDDDEMMMLFFDKSFDSFGYFFCAPIVGCPRLEGDE